MNTEFEHYLKDIGMTHVLIDKIESLLKEFSELPKKVPSEIPLQRVRAETVNFVRMLERIVQRRRGQDVSPTFNGNVIKCSIVLVARSGTYLTRGINPYLSFINKSAREGIETFYVCAIGNQNVSITQEIIDW